MTHLLEVRSLITDIATPTGTVRPVDGVDLTLARGEMVGIVGESGSGKTMLVRSIMGLMPPNAKLTPPGKVIFDGQDITDLGARERRNLWGKRIALIPQDPATSLNPVRKVGVQIADTLVRHGNLPKAEARKAAAKLLGDVGMADPERRLHLYPHEMSGGMRQRVLIAIAIANSPEMLIADEPTTALDVTIQKQILDLIDTLRRERNIGVLLISHDLAVVAGRSDRVVVMYGGRLVEALPSSALVPRRETPVHPGAAGKRTAHRCAAAGDAEDHSGRAARHPHPQQARLPVPAAVSERDRGLRRRHAAVGAHRWRPGTRCRLPQPGQRCQAFNR